VNQANGFLNKHLVPALTAVSENTYMSAIRAGSKKAATALARKLLSYAWSVCQRGQPFVWPNTQKPTGVAPAVPVWSYDI